ncbi:MULTISPECIES: PAS domain S-box protein [unclassified Brevibacillus]|uniref:PAS domain-containing sensor histidine kinase n=1 Tax=unclassified Brevibacillus TaxID=2684853 RepID=UPI00156BB3E8|nr:MULTISPECIES: PAS domain S-box protein [unclassified Brevibacillus]NRQ53499.1 PAS domain S-box protein [Brevibacillus sp. HD1.4A]UED68647.1 PAS domain S-box protein [Brevibacillus sp. HD3.3A]
MGTQLQLYNSLFHNNPDAVYIIDMHGNLTGVNAAGEELLGYSAPELLRMKMWELIAPVPQPDKERLVSLLKEGVRKNIPYRLRHRDGRYLEISISSFPIFHNGEIVCRYSIAKDVTRQKQTEEALLFMQENFRLISENIMDLILIVDLNGHITYASPSIQSVLGLSASHILLRHFSVLIQPEQRQAASLDFQKMIVDKIPLEAEYSYRHPDGRMLIFEFKGTPDIGADGHVKNTVIVARDITERRHSEELLRYSDKLSALGELAAGIAHEIRNPLTSLKGFLQLMESEPATNHQYVQIMLSEIERISSITSELLLMAKPQTQRYAPNGLLPLLHSVIKLLAPQALLKNVNIVTHFPSATSLIPCEEYQIKQVFINIIKNGMEAMPSGGILSIAVVEDDQNVLVRVTDQGHGIPEELLPRLGELFYTTKETGTGLGLLVSSKIIRDHGGTLEITSKLGKGTTVMITLPKVVQS